MPFVDFAELKTRVSIERAVHMLGLNLQQHGHQYRGACPSCKAGGDRALVITPAKSLFYCFSKKVGGDQIALVAHIQGSNLTEAAAFLDGNCTVPTSKPSTGNSTVPGTVPPAPAVKKPGFDAEAYAARLDPAHASLATLGLSVETLKTWKAGYSNSGTNRGRLAIALHDRDGNILGFAGRSLNDEQPTLTLPNGIDPQAIIFGSERVEQGTLYLVRDVLDVLRAHENGVANCVCFLSEISALQIEMLAALMATRRCDTVELF